MDWPEIKSELFRLTAQPSSVASVAKELGIDRATIYRWLRGDTYQPHPIVLRHVEQVVVEIKKKSP